MKYTPAYLKEKYEELLFLETLADMADEAMTEDPENAEKEKAFDAAYAAEWKAYEHVLEILMDLTGCTKDTARVMFGRQRDKIENLLARLAA